MMRFKRILSFVSAILFLLSFCACSSYVKHKPNSNDNSSAASSSDIASSVVSVPSHTHGFDPYEGIPDEIKGVTVKLAIWEDYYSKINYIGDMPMASIYEDIGIRAEYVSIPESGYVAAISSKIASGDAPDVFKSGFKNPFPLTLDIAAPINIVSTVNLNEPIWDQSLLKTATIDNNVYLLSAIGSPWNSTIALYYSKPVFESNGIKTPAEYYEEGNWTWDNFKKCILEIKRIDPTIQGAYLERDHFLNSKGFSLLQYNSTLNSFSNGVSNEFFSAYNQYLQMKNDGFLDGFSLGSVVEGKCAMAAAELTVLKNVPIASTDRHKDVGITYLPSDQAGKASKVISEHVMYGIVDGAKNADAAGYFIRYWLDPENYNLTKCFYNMTEGNFYYQLTNEIAENKFFNFDDAGAMLVNRHSKEGLWSIYNNPYGPSAPANALSSEVSSAKDAANTKISERRNKTITEYSDFSKWHPKFDHENYK